MSSFKVKQNLLQPEVNLSEQFCNQTSTNSQPESQETRIRLVNGKLIYPKFYFRWRAMKYRCLNKKSSEYTRYGGRGISVCKEWLSYRSFHEWCNNTFEEGKTIDRIDNDKGYSPHNCRWATPLEQQKNSRNTQAKKDAVRYASTFRTKEGFVRDRGKNGRFKRKF